VHLFISSTFTTKISGKPVTVTMDTNMPWEGDVKLTVQSEADEEVTLAVRIPSWTADAYTSSTQGEVRDGYMYITLGKKSAGSSEEVQFRFSMEPKIMYAHPKTKKDEVATMRGPLVYCAESPDNEFDLEDAYVDAGSLQPSGTIDLAHFTSVPLVKMDAVVKTAEGVSLYQSTKPELKVEKHELILLPFFLRMNRGGSGAMRVWFRINRDR
jgi:DUF1680 family protein